MSIKGFRIFIAIFSCIVFVFTIYFIIDYQTQEYDGFSEDINVHIGNNAEKIKIWYDQTSGDNVLFVPQKAQILQNSNEYSICRGDSIYSVFIDTQSKSLKNIHQRKGNEEGVNIRVFDKYGVLCYKNENYENVINGRGSSTWLQEKKPYLITLRNESEFVGLPKGNKWVFLSNSFDESNIRNKLVFNLGQQLDFRWTPHTQYADVWINGRYSGLYLIAEKIDCSQNRLSIVQETPNSFLCHLASINQVKIFNQKYWFLTKYGSCVQIDYPIDPSKNTIEDIKIHIEKLEDNIRNTNYDISKILDLKSWCTKFLIDQVFENTDGDFISSYFYYSTVDSLFFAGPLWDYDQIIGNNHDFNYNYKSFSVTDYSVFFKVLYNNRIFKNEARLIYNEKLKYCLNSVDDTIRNIRCGITKSSIMNSRRYKTMYDYLHETWSKVNTIDEISAHLQNRFLFIGNILNDTIDYHRIIFKLNETEPGIGYFVCDGEPLDFMPNLYNDSISWEDMKTESSIGLGDTIHQSLCLRIKNYDEQEITEIEFSIMRIGYYLFFLLSFLLILFGFIKKR